MKWSVKEDEIVVKYYLAHKKTYLSNINIVMEELKNNGFNERDESSTKMRLSNIEYLDTGKGLSKVSKQTKYVYNRLVNKY